MLTRAAALACLASLVCCSGAPPQTCTPEARAALTALYEKAAVQAVEAGECDSAPSAEECLAVKTLTVHMRMAQKAMCP